MTAIGIPGVYAAQRDTWLLAGVLETELVALPARPRILEIGTGSGHLAVLAAGHDGAQVTAVDISRRALVNARCAAVRRGVRLRLRHGDLVAPVADETFDLVITNPPYVPAVGAEVPRRGRTRAWDAGHDGRLVLDRLCRDVPTVLAPGGTVLIVQSALAGVDATVGRLEAEGLTTDIAARCTHPFGPVLHSRIAYLESVGLLEDGCRDEELVVIRGRA